MSKNGKFDFKEFKEFQKNFESMVNKHDEVLKNTAQELAKEWLTRTKYRVHPVTGNLNNNWRIEIQENGNDYLIIMSNSADYAPYVESGHRTKEKKDGSRGWIKGQFMMTKSKSEVENMAPRVLEKRLQQLFNEAINGK